MKYVGIFFVIAGFLLGRCAAVELLPVQKKYIARELLTISPTASNAETGELYEDILQTLFASPKWVAEPLHERFNSLQLALDELSVDQDSITQIPVFNNFREYCTQRKYLELAPPAPSLPVKRVLISSSIAFPCWSNCLKQLEEKEAQLAKTSRWIIGFSAIEKPKKTDIQALGQQKKKQKLLRAQIAELKQDESPLAAALNPRITRTPVPDFDDLKERLFQLEADVLNARIKRRKLQKSIDQ